MKSHRLSLEAAFACTVHPALVNRALRSELKLLQCVHTGQSCSSKIQALWKQCACYSLKTLQTGAKSQKKICLSSLPATNRNPANHSSRCFSSCHSPQRDFLVKLAIKRNARELIPERDQSRCDWCVVEERDGRMRLGSSSRAGEKRPLYHLTTVQFCEKPSVMLITYATFMFALQQLSRSHQCQVNGKKSVTSNTLNDIFSVRRDKVCGSRSCSMQVVHLLFPRSMLTSEKSKKQIS